MLISFHTSQDISLLGLSLIHINGRVTNSQFTFITGDPSEARCTGTSELIDTIATRPRVGAGRTDALVKICNGITVTSHE